MKPVSWGTDNQGVINALENAYNMRLRVRLYLGYETDGKTWGEEHDVEGTIGFSTGPKPVPLLINNRGSLGGPSILTHCILRVVTSSSPYTVLYTCPNFDNGHWEVRDADAFLPPEYTTSVYRDGENVANFRQKSAAVRWVKQMTKGTDSPVVINCK